jgi:hypothetical protein
MGHDHGHAVAARNPCEGKVGKLEPDPHGAMVEVIAAIAGASISVAAMGAAGFSRKSDEAREAVIRLTSAVEHIATQLEVLHQDIKEDRKETFGRLSTVEQRVSKLEARPPAC